MNSPFKLAAVGLAALALAACSGTSSSIPGPAQNSGTMSGIHGTQFSVAGLDLSKVHIMQTVSNHVRGFNPNAPQTLTYRGGPVERTPRVYVAYWGFGTYGDPSGEMPYMNAFLNGMGGSTWLRTDSQYYQIVGGVHQKIGNPTGQLKGSWIDNSAVPSSPTDAQIQGEAKRLAGHFGFNKYASYVVATPTQHNTAGFGSSFCAYHGAFTGPKGVIAYTNMPYIPDAGANCGAGFINTPGTLDGVSIVEGHEYAETETDPQPPSGWYNNSYGEIGDICAWMIPPAGNVVFTTGTFAVQGLWSNHSSACVISGP